MMKKILIADESTRMRMMLRDIIGGGYNIIEVYDKETTIEKYKEIHPDLALLAFSLSPFKEDGLEALKLILAYDPKIKVVILSTLDNQSEVFEAIRIGAKDILLKPFNKQKVLAVVHNLIED